MTDDSEGGGDKNSPDNASRIVWAVSLEQRMTTTSWSGDENG